MRHSTVPLRRIPRWSSGLRHNLDSGSRNAASV
jgi:hypothetical protein